MGAQRLDVLLVLDAEALLLVDHHQAEVLPAHAGLQQPVGADHDVHAAVGHPGQHLLGLTGVGEARQRLNGDREPGHPFGEGLQVLIGQQRGGHQHGHLLAVLHGLERRPHRDLGLAVADVTADHPVHRHGLFHVGLHLADRGQLVGGLGEAERVLHLGLPRGVGLEGVPRCGLALGVEGDQFGGDLANRLARLRFRVGPVAAAQPAQRRLLAADVARQLIQGVHRDVELVGLLAASAAGVLQHEVLAARAADGALDHLDEPSDAVLVVHHQITRGQRQRVDGVTPARGQPLALGPGGAVAGQIGLGDHHQLGRGHHDPGVQRALEHPDHAGRRCAAGLEQRGRGVAFGELLDDPVRGARAGRHHRGQPPGEHVGAQHREDLLDVALLAARRRCGLEAQVDRTLGAQLADRPPRVPAGAGGLADLVEVAEPRPAELLDVHRRLTADRGHRPRGLQELLSGADQIGRAGAHLLGVAHQQRGVRREVVGEQAQPSRAQHRLQGLHPVDRDAFGKLGQHVGDTADHRVLPDGAVCG